MREEELFNAYRNHYDESKTEGPEIDARFTWMQDQVSVKCLHPSCPVMIALYAQRFYCRYHERKLREERKTR